MKVIFLDIDGVLNVIPTGSDEFGHIFHKHFEDNLKNVIDKTGAKIVISSTWRYEGLERMKTMWVKRNLPGEVIDITPDLTNRRPSGLYTGVKRGIEIEKWLSDHKDNIESYVILDDDNDMLENQLPNFVCTFANEDHEDCIDFGYGLTKKCTEKAIEILNKTTFQY